MNPLMGTKAPAFLAEEKLSSEYENMRNSLNGKEILSIFHTFRGFMFQKEVIFSNYIFFLFKGCKSSTFLLFCE